MDELIIKMPKAKNTFTGRCTIQMDQFETFKSLVGIGVLKMIFTDGMVRTVKIEQWMVDHAQPRAHGVDEYMLVTYSKNRYQNDKLSAKKFGEDSYYK